MGGTHLILAKNLSYRETKAFEKLLKNDNEGITYFLNSMDEFVILIDPHTKAIIFANAYARKEIPYLEGRRCWEALGYKKPCCNSNSCLYRKTFQVEKAEDIWKEHNITRINLPNKVLIMESIKEINSEIIKEREKDFKNDLFYMTSHELKAPLNIISSTIQLLEKFNKNWQSAETLKHTRRIKKATDQIDKLLQNILLAGRTKAQKIDFNPKAVDVIKLIKHILEGFQEDKENSVKIKFNNAKESLIANIDEFILTTVLNNILNNAVKYSKTNGEVVLNIDSDDKNITFTIADEGIGIPEEEQQNLFKIFYRASNAGSISGTGLGLAIVKDLVSIHKGYIDFSSKENEGTTFTVEIPTVFQ